MKRIALMMLALSIVVMAFVGCTPTESQPSAANPTPGTSGTSTPAPTVDAEPVTLTLLGTPAQEQNMNIARDLLTKAGFNIQLELAPDYSSATSIVDSGEWDLYFTGWTSVSGSDYAVRSLFYTDAPYNDSGMADPEVDQLIDDASSAPISESWDIYAQLERVLVEDNAYLIPLFSNMGHLAVNQEVMNIDTVLRTKSRPVGEWEMYDYNDTTLRETRPFVTTFTNSQYLSYWPPRNSIASLTSNTFIRLLNMDVDDNITTDSSISHNYAETADSSSFYFLLRDDVTYAKVENGAVVDTGIKVSADDVVFSMDLNRNKDAVPTHRTYTLFQKINGVSVVTDLAELEAATVDGSKVIDLLNDGLAAPIATLTDDIAAVDNAAGAYQVVKVTTDGPFSQIVNYLAHFSAGIYNKESVESVMENVDIANYDPATDVIYGDANLMMKDSDNYDNHMLYSGPYVAMYHDQYMAVMERNPGFMPETDRFAKIDEVHVKFITQADSAAASFRAGELDMITSVPEQLISVIESDPKFSFTSRATPSVTYATINMNPEHDRVVMDEDVRKAILYSIDQNAYIAYYNGNKMPAYTTLTPLFAEAPNALVADPNKVSEHLAAYHAKQG